MNPSALKPSVLALGLAFAASMPAAATAPLPAASHAPAAADWVATSNRHAQMLLQAQAQFEPERALVFGMPGYDDQAADLGPG